MLVLTNLVGFATGNRAKSYQYMGSDSDASNATSYTFTGKSLGRSAVRKYIVVAVTVRISAGASGGIATVSVGGNSATQVVQTTDQATQPVVGLYIVNYSGNANETGNITITTSQTSIACAIAWYSLYNFSSMTAHSTATSTASPISLSYNLPNNGMCVAVSGNSTSSTATWSGTPAEDYDIEYDTGITASGASKVTTTAVAEVTTCIWTAYSNPKGVAASFA